MLLALHLKCGNKTVTMLEYATIDEAWKRSPLLRQAYIPRDTMKYTEPIAQISNDMPQQMTGPQSGSEYHRLDNRSMILKGTDTVVNQQMIRIKINLHET
jgi:hypothetical protein